MKAYISGIGSVSPLESFGSEMGIPEKKISPDGFPHLVCVEPVYKDYINPALLRRMSRVMKMGITTAMLSLKDAKVDVPEAVITATGLGCVEDSDKFLTSLIEYEEKMLNPTPFIQSTHNTIGSQIALQVKCHGYNTTYAGRGACFEMALLDSLMLLEEGEANNVLTGSFDEITPNLITIENRLGLFREKQKDQSENFGGLPGEGSVFAMLNSSPAQNDIAVLQGVSIFPIDKDPVEQLKEFLSEQGFTIEDLDVIISGTYQWKKLNTVYAKLLAQSSGQSSILGFKHLCGEYPTASSFAFYLAAQILGSQTIPSATLFRKGEHQTIQNVLIFNHSLGNQYAAILLTRC